MLGKNSFKDNDIDFKLKKLQAKDRLSSSRKQTKASIIIVGNKSKTQKIK